MKISDLIATANHNLFRNKTRTILTMLLYYHHQRCPSWPKQFLGQPNLCIWWRRLYPNVRQDRWD